MSDQHSKTSGFGMGEAGKVPATTPADEAEAARLQPVRVTKVSLCDCGHKVPAAWVMRASMGTSCPDCFDSMSD